MVDHLRTLRTRAGRLRALHADLYPAILARRAWQDHVFARRTFQDDTEVELWYLAQHYLVSWHDWHSLRDRFLRYFGADEERLPETWLRLDTDGEILAGLLLRDQVLDGLIAKFWWSTGLIETGDQAKSHYSVSAIFELFAENHQRWAFLNDTTLGQVALAERPLPAAGKVWPTTNDILRRSNGVLLEFWDQLAENMRDEVLYHLRQYQHAHLLVSWLDGGDADDGEKGGSAFQWVLQREKPVIPSFSEFLNTLPADRELRGGVEHMLNRIATAVGDIGYENFVEDVSSKELRGGDESLVGTGQINVLPSKTKRACTAITLAVSRGEKRPFAFAEVMKQLRAHLIRCAGTVRVVIVLCDRWLPDMLDDHIGDLQAHQQRGVRFLFVLIGTPGRVLSPIAVDLGLSASLSGTGPEG